MMKLSGCDCPSAGPHPVRGRHHRHEDDVIRIRTSLGLCTAQTHPIHSVVHDLVHDSWCHGGFVRAQLSERLLVLPAFQDFDKPPCTMPISPLGKRIKYDIKEYHPVRHFLKAATGLLVVVRAHFMWYTLQLVACKMHSSLYMMCLPLIWCYNCCNSRYCGAVISCWTPAT